MKKYIKDETKIKFDNYEQLSYLDLDKPSVILYVDDKAIGNIKVCKDNEMDNREYVCINYEVVYLDSIKNIN